jgi:hypothetical protein
MIRKICRLVGLVAVGLGAVYGCLPRSACALDTPNTLFTIDGMVLNHQGLFRSANPADGFNTFSFGPFAATGNLTALGRYRSFNFLTTGTGDKGISNNARLHSDTPEHWNGSAYQIPDRSGGALDLTNSYYPAIDRSFGGQIFDPAEYQIEVKFKPNFGKGGPIFDNTAPLFTVGLDQLDGFVWDAEASAYKRANDAFTYNIGSTAVPINDWYATAPKDANGFATYTVPASSPNFVQRGFYFKFGDGTFRTADVVTGGGRVQNEDLTWSDVNDGLDPLSFGGGATDPARPGSQLKVPNGVPLMSFGAPAAETGLSVEINYITLKKINPGQIAARIDANSGITYRFGSGFGRSTTAAPIDIPGDVYGLGYIPAATDQISRFDENGMTNLIFNMRTPDNANETHRFVVREGPGATSFDGTTATVNVRAKLLAGNTVPNLTIVAKDLDGNDTAAGTGADEYTYNLPLSMFNSSTFTTVSIPLSDFVLSTFVPGPPSSGPFGFTNAGDGLRTNFDLYEFAGLIAPDTGLLKMELEYMEVRLPSQALVGDYNNDGSVNAADYTVWRNNLGGDGSTLGANRDPANGSGPVSAADYSSWKAHFGEPGAGSGGLSSAAVPEPATLTLIGLVLAAAAVVRPKR